ncbi:MAG: hypothetical protein LBC19_03050 [Tannerella sp.]|jgi:hypothetical protein|nr:hypothetical protein [Tannerella sp.]
MIILKKHYFCAMKEMIAKSESEYSEYKLLQEENKLRQEEKRENTFGDFDITGVSTTVA